MDFGTCPSESGETREIAGRKANNPRQSKIDFIEKRKMILDVYIYDKM